MYGGPAAFVLCLCPYLMYLLVMNPARSLCMEQAFNVAWTEGLGKGRGEGEGGRGQGDTKRNVHSLGRVVNDDN